MSDSQTTVAGLVVSSDSPVFLAIVGLHVLVALACVVLGFVAMMSSKRPGRHPRFGTAYYVCLSAVFASAIVLSAMRWAQDYPLFIIGMASFAAAWLGRAARRNRWRGWVRLHISGMGASYVLLLIVFYVDNGANLPIWRDLPRFTYWLLPIAVGVPLILFVLIRHPLALATEKAVTCK
jgi:uncharacterized membrane protein